MLSSKSLFDAVSTTIESVRLPGWNLCQSGKVRDIFTLDDECLLIVTTDRVSAFDRILGTIPHKGQVLNQLSAWWFAQTADIVRNHLVIVPDPNAMIVRKVEPLPVEVIVRGYITGVTDTSLWTLYANGDRCPYGITLPDGLRKNSPLPSPVITPTTKAEKGAHDERLTREAIISKNLVEESLWEQVETVALALFARGQEAARQAGLILVDTKYEFGLLDGELILIDEVHTPDSSRFWTQESYEGAGRPENCDKEVLREWFVAQGYRGEGTPPPVTPEKAVQTARMYISLYERLTGQTFEPDAQPADERITQNLRKNPVSSPKNSTRPEDRDAKVHKMEKTALVPIIMGSHSDLDHSRKIAAELYALGIETVFHIGSAHKTPEHLLSILAGYKIDPRPMVFITVAGRSNALSGFVDAQVKAPVIACPPPSDSFGGADLFSSIRMPGGVAPALVLDPTGAALLAAKILGLSHPAIADAVTELQSANRSAILRDNQCLHQADHPRESCGVFGICAPGREAARLTFFALYALQHRGQEGAGIATCDGQTAYTHRGMGLVSQIFKEEDLAPLKGFMAIGHNRYATTGATHIRNAQPFLIETMNGPLGVAHNGNIVNAAELRSHLLERGVGLSTTTDSELITQLLAAPSPASSVEDGPMPGADDNWVDRIRAVMAVAEGAYSLAVLTRDAVYAVRDPRGMRPLCIGRLDKGHVIASETCALNTINAEFTRHVRPGEIVRLSKKGITSFEGLSADKHALCVFEYIYFSRPDSLLRGQLIHQVRQRLGRQLALEAPVEADLVLGVPDSATPAAIGYSLESGVPYNDGLTKNRYIGRTFIQPDDRLRQQGVSLKFNPLAENLRGQRVVLVDDSIVRGNTSGPIVQLIRHAGATEIHVRVSSPPIRHPCFMGIDMATYSELIAHRLDVDAICRSIGADTLHYLSFDGMLKSIDTRCKDAHCTACFTGRYPLPIPKRLLAEDMGKLHFEKVWGS
ncbi:MAG: hypothetical protein B6D68_02015 [spirochete symbiont of Stewartia floridana]|nr:MAG: hypothetical protein B6D68_02015 [spirochete symbiont of Stewartia floridana]